MRAVVQRVNGAAVKINGEVTSSVGEGLLVLLGIEHEDTSEDADWLSQKIASLRIFDDEKGVMNLDVQQAGGEILIISQFTLHAKTKKETVHHIFRPLLLKKPFPFIIVLS